MENSNIDEILSKYLELKEELKEISKVYNMNKDAYFVNQLLDIYREIVIDKKQQIYDFNDVLNSIIKKYDNEIKEYCKYINRNDLYEKLYINKDDNNEQVLYKTYALKQVLYNISNLVFKKQIEDKVSKEILKRIFYDNK